MENLTLAEIIKMQSEIDKNIGNYHPDSLIAREMSKRWNELELLKSELDSDG